MYKSCCCTFYYLAIEPSPKLLYVLRLFISHSFPSNQVKKLKTILFPSIANIKFHLKIAESNYYICSCFFPYNLVYLNHKLWAIFHFLGIIWCIFHLIQESWAKIYSLGVHSLPFPAKYQILIFNLCGILYFLLNVYSDFEFWLTNY